MKSRRKASLKRELIQVFIYFFSWIGALIVSVIGLFAAVLVILPILASSNQFKTALEKETSEYFGRPIRIGRIVWTFSEGLLVKGVRIFDEPGYSQKPMLMIGRIGVWAGGFTGDPPGVRFECIVDGMVVRLIRNPDGTTNLESLLSVFQKAEKPPEKPKKPPEPFNIHSISAKTPVNLNFRFHLNGFSCLLSDRLNRRTLLVEDCIFHVDIPSLLTRNIDLKTAAGVEFNGRKFPPAQFGFTLQRLFDSGGTMTLPETVTEMNAALPGLKFDLSADLARAAVNSNIHIDFSALTSLAKPFLPEPYASSEFNGTCGIQMMANQFLDQNGGLDISNLSLAVNGDLPGIEIKIQGDMKQQGVKSDVRIDLKALKDFAAPVLPPDLTDLQVDGRLELLADAFQKTDSRAAFDIRLKGSQISADHGPLNEKTAGPLSFRLFNQGAWNLKSGKLDIQKGGFEFQDNSYLNWEGEAGGLQTANPMIRLTISPLKLNLTDILSVFKDFQPKELALPDTGTPSDIHVREILVNGAFPTGRGVIEISGVDARISEIQQKTGSAQRIIRDLRISPLLLNIGLVDLFPERISVSAGASIGSIDIEGEAPLSVKNVEIPELLIRSEKIRRNEKAPFTIVCDLQIDETLKIGRLTIPSTIDMSNIYQSVTANIALPERRPADIKIGTFRAILPDIKLEHARLGPIATNAEIKGHAGGITLTSMDPPAADVTGAALRLEAGDMIKLVMNADAERSGEKSLKSQGTVFLNLTRLNDVLVSKIIDDPNLGGNAEIGWRFTGRTPGEKELNMLQGENPAAHIGSALDFIENAAFTLNMDDIRIDAPMGDGGRIKCGPIRTKSPLSYEFSGKTGKGDLNLEVAADSIDELFIRRFEPPLTVSLSVSASHNGLQSIHFKQRLTLDALEFLEHLNISVHGMDRALKKSMSPSIGTLIQSIGATAEAGVRLNNAAALQPLIPDIQMSGSAGANLQFTFKPGDSAETKIHIDMTDFSAGLENSIQVQNLQTGLDLGKKYLIHLEDQQESNKRADKSGPLSMEVLKTHPKSLLNVPESGQYGYGSLVGGRFDPSRLIAFDAAQIESTPAPLRLGPSMFDFRLKEGLPQISPFQVEMLGGALNGGLAIVKSNSNFFLRAGLMFSGLDMRRLIPEAASGAGSDEDTEISGRLFLALPLITEIKPLIRNLELDLQFSHIGSKSLEWLLYSLDPSESDETIVSQRKLARNGSPRHIHIRMNDGGFSLTGEVEVKGVPVAIPPISRLNIGSLSGIETYEQQLELLKPVINALQKASSNAIQILDDGSILFKN